jgi:hypothetical protein
MCSRQLRDGSNTKLDHRVSATDDFLKRYAIVHEVLPGQVAYRAPRHRVKPDVNLLILFCHGVTKIKASYRPSPVAWQTL